MAENGLNRPFGSSFSAAELYRKVPFILKPDRVHELIDRVQKTTRGGQRILAGTSSGGGTIPKKNVVRASDFLLIHGNGVTDPNRVAEMV